MSSYSKLVKNAEKFKMEQMYNNMTPEQYKEGIRNAVKISTENLAKEYDKQIRKIQEQANFEINQGIKFSINIISVELLYEIANQMECFVDEPEYLDQKIDKIQAIYENTLNVIENYTNYKKQGQARKDFEKKQKIIEKMFNIKF